MSYYKFQTPEEAQSRISVKDKVAALAWLEQVGSWPSSDRQIQATTDAANDLLGIKRR